MQGRGPRRTVLGPGQRDPTCAAPPGSHRARARIDHRRGDRPVRSGARAATRQVLAGRPVATVAAIAGSDFSTAASATNSAATTSSVRRRAVASSSDRPRTAVVSTTSMLGRGPDEARPVGRAAAVASPTTAGLIGRGGGGPDQHQRGRGQRADAQQRRATYVGGQPDGGPVVGAGGRTLDERAGGTDDDQPRQQGDLRGVFGGLEGDQHAARGGDHRGVDRRLPVRPRAAVRGSVIMKNTKIRISGDRTTTAVPVLQAPDRCQAPTGGHRVADEREPRHQ